MKKRILIFSVAYHPFIGGAEIAVKEITARISDCEFDMITVNLDGKQKSEEKVGNIMVYRVGSGTIGKFLLPLAGYLKARSLHKKNPYTSIWSIMASHASIAASFFKITHKNIPLVLTVQEGDEESHLKRYVFGLDIFYKIIIRPWYRLVFKKADLITAISTYLARRAQEINPHAEMQIIPNGVDVSVFTRSFTDAEREIAMQEVGKEKGDRLLITTSRLVLKNAVGDIIAALSLLPSSIKLVILGTGALEKDLRKQAEDLKLSNRVVFLGQKAYEDIPKYLAVSDIFIRPSLSEGMGNSFIEAMAAGIPVIATPVGGITDFLFDNKTGVFCNVHDPQSIAWAVEQILSHPELKETIITNARKLVLEKYDWDLIAEGMKNKAFLGLK